MRKKRWIAPVWMLAAAALGQTAIAQNPASPLEGPFPPAPPVVPGMMPPGPMAPGPVAYSGQPTYTPVAPDAASPAGFPPEMEAWPTISPFEHAFDQTYNDDGIWFRQQLNHQRKYQVNMEFISAKFKAPGDAAIGFNSVIGSPGTHLGTAEDGLDPRGIYSAKDFGYHSQKGRYFRETDGSYDATSPSPSGAPPRRVVLSSEQIGDPSTDDLTFREPKAGLVQIVNFADDPNEDINDTDGIDDDEVADTVHYAATGGVLDEDAVTLFGGTIEKTAERRRNPSSPGLRLSFGLEEEDDTGFLWSGYWINGQESVFRRGFDDPTRPVVTNIVFFEAPHLGAAFPGDLGEGKTIPAVEVLDYNTLFEVTNETEMGGTDLAFYHTPFVDLGWLRMRPLFGARYDYIRETFSFTGKDNGVAYSFDWDGDALETEGDDDAAGVAQSTLPVLSSDLIAQNFEDPIQFSQLFPYETTALSKVRSHLYGPQVGFDMQLGGEYLMLSSVTKAGVVVNTEKLSLDTSGFGTHEALTGERIFESDSKTHTRLVPFLEFNANADINVFPIIPVVNRWNWLENARIRAGWTALVVGNIQRPIDQIAWRTQHSGGSYIKERGRDVWYTQYWNLGVHWEF